MFYEYMPYRLVLGLSGFFWDKVWLFMVKIGWQTCEETCTLSLV